MKIKMLKLPPDGVKLFVEGRMDAVTAQAAQDSFLKVAKEYHRITLDLNALEYISSAGLRSLLVLQKQMDRTRGTLTVTRVPPAVDEVFELTGFNSFLNVE